MSSVDDAVSDPPAILCCVKMEKDVITEFIELYKNRPCLWNNRLPQYSNKNNRNDALCELLKVLIKIDPSANLASVRSKIDNLRSNFKRERKKVISSEISGCSEDEVYRPSLWYYDLMAFIDIGFEGQSSSVESLFDSTKYLVRSPIRSSQKSATAPPALKRLFTGKTSQKRSKLTDKYTNDNENSDDEFDSFGKMAAKTLRKLSNPYQSVALKLMSDVLFQAKLGLINVDSTITTPPRAFSNFSDSPSLSNTHSPDHNYFIVPEIKYHVPQGSKSPTDPLGDNTAPEKHSQLLSQILTNQIEYTVTTSNVTSQPQSIQNIHEPENIDSPQLQIQDSKNNIVDNYSIFQKK